MHLLGSAVFRRAMLASDCVKCLSLVLLTGFVLLTLFMLASGARASAFKSWPLHSFRFWFRPNAGQGCLACHFHASGLRLHRSVIDDARQTPACLVFSCTYDTCSVFLPRLRRLLLLTHWVRSSKKLSIPSVPNGCIIDRRAVLIIYSRLRVATCRLAVPCFLVLSCLWGKQ